MINLAAKQYYPAFRGDKVELLDAVVICPNDNCEVLTHINLLLLKVNLIILLHLDEVKE